MVLPLHICSQCPAPPDASGPCAGSVAPLTLALKSVREIAVFSGRDHGLGPHPPRDPAPKRAAGPHAQRGALPAVARKSSYFFAAAVVFFLTGAFAAVALVAAAFGAALGSAWFVPECRQQS